MREILALGNTLTTAGPSIGDFSGTVQMLFDYPGYAILYNGYAIMYNGSFLSYNQ